jgi:gliding motility-associated-like protein
LHFTAPGYRVIHYFNIYNRSGNLIFSSNNYKTGWDGTFRGEPLSTGTYVWIAKGTDFTGTINIKKGAVLLLK